MSVTYMTRIPELTAEAEAKATRIVHRRAFDVLAASRTAVPVKTGNLKNSSHVELSGARAVISYSANYAAFVELGTRYMQPPRAYLRPAFDKYAPIMLRDLKAVFI